MKTKEITNHNGSKILDPLDTPAMKLILKNLQKEMKRIQNEPDYQPEEDYSSSGRNI